MSSETPPAGVQLKREVVNSDWVDHQACTLLQSHKHALSNKMDVVPSSFITNDIF